MTFTDELARVAEPIWEATVEHPMVEQLGAGTLDVAPFRYWVEQDYVYLVEFNRVFAYTAAKAPTVEHIETFARLLYETVTTEMDLHRSYATEFGLTEADLEATEPSPTTQAYADFLVRTSATGTFGDAVAATLPCMWGFNDTARRLEADGLPDDERYASWIETYAGEEFTELADLCRGLLDDVAADGTDADRQRYRDVFVTSARYEYRFWDAAWREEAWTV
ncbi:MAG: thiaminase II [Halobacteriota archaeon]